MSRSAGIIHWFRRDLRLADNPAFSAAAQSGLPVLPVYVLDPAAETTGAASRWWLHGSLESLDRALREKGARLILRRGSTIEQLLEIAKQSGAHSIHFTRGYEPVERRQEQELATACEKAGLAVRRYAGAALSEPEVVRTQAGAPFRVFTPFWRACLASPAPAPALAVPARLIAPPDDLASDALADWDLLPSKPDWAGGLRSTWQPGETGAVTRLKAFLDGPVATYHVDRDRPDQVGTSRLSPHLHFGELSPRQCWHSARIAATAEPSSERGTAAFLRELGWREFSIHLLFHWPHIVDRPFRDDFAAFPWTADKQQAARDLATWQRGRTGYPIVDAGMRELWQTGWMHNRVRMIVASFLCKHLLIPWQEGARWFLDTLVDADLASNQASWQWVAGSGADAAPYFRIFNPILQGQKFDPDGDYVRRYVPELAALPSAHIHSPWTAPKDVLAAAGVVLGKSYPLPMVDHAVARSRALAAYAAMSD